MGYMLYDVATEDCRKARRLRYQNVVSPLLTVTDR